MNQQEHDLRSLAWHTHVVERMREDPELMQKALAIGTRWLALGPRRSDVYIRAWVELLRQDIEAVAEVATASTERATAMRQSSPVACVLGREERNAFWAAWSPPENTRASHQGGLRRVRVARLSLNSMPMRNHVPPVRREVRPQKGFGRKKQSLAFLA